MERLVESLSYIFCSFLQHSGSPTERESETDEPTSEIHWNLFHKQQERTSLAILHKLFERRTAAVSNTLTTLLMD